MDYTIKDLPRQERPREKLEEKGVSSLTEVELLSLILRTGTSGKNVKELSAEVLNRYSLGSIADRSMEELEKIEGISTVKAGQLKAVSQLARQIQREDREEIRSFPDVKDRVRDMKFLEEERLRTLVLSSGNRLLEEKEIDGEVSSINFSPKKIFQAAIKRNGAAIILAHNHPSGRSDPTEEDIQTTKKLIELGEKLGVEVLDHVVVGEEIRSMKAERDIFV